MAKTELCSPMLFVRQECQILKHFLDEHLATREIPNRMMERLQITGERDLIRNRRRDLPDGHTCQHGCQTGNSFVVNRR